MFKEFNNILALSNGLNPTNPCYDRMLVSEFLDTVPDISIRLRNALMKYPDLSIIDITHRLHRGIGISLMEELDTHLKRLERN